MLLAAAPPIAATTDPMVWVTLIGTIITAVVALVGTVGLWVYNWKREGRQHTWTKEEADAVAVTLADKVKLQQEAVAAKVKEDAAAVRLEQKEEQDRVAIKLVDAADLLLRQFKEIQAAAGAAFEVGNHSKQEVAVLTKEMIDLRKEFVLMRSEINGEAVVPTLESLSKQVHALTKLMTQRGGKR